MRLLGRRVYGSEAEGTQEVVECFCGGLRDTDLAAKMLQKRFDSLSAAIEYASERKGTSNIKAMLTHRATGKMRATDASLLNMECSEGTVVREEVDAVQAGRQSTHPKVQPPVTRQQNQFAGPSGQQQHQQLGQPTSTYTRGDVVCYNCRGVGHIRRDCTMPQQPFSDVRSQQPTRAPVVCHNCGRTGHMKRQCWAGRAPGNGRSQGYTGGYTPQRGSNQQGMQNRDFRAAPGTQDRRGTSHSNVRTNAWVNGGSAWQGAA